MTEEVASELSADGRFKSPAVPDEAYPQVSPERAAEIALAWARTFGPYFWKSMERDHGSPIDFAALRVGSPAYYAAAVYEPVARDVHPGLRNAFSPQYLVYLVDDEGPVLSLAIAAFTEAVVENGRMRLPTHSGMDVSPAAVPAGVGFALPPSPEHAAAAVGRANGARVARVPELIAPPDGYHPQHARWKVTLDRPVRVRGGRGSAERSIQEIYVGLRGEMTDVSGMQPEGVDVYDPRTKRSFRLPRRPARPAAFEPIRIATQ